LHRVVITRQKYKRHLKGRPLSKPLRMFPGITFKDVDHDIPHCLKYLLNFGFYRFGVEVLFIYNLIFSIYFILIFMTVVIFVGFIVFLFFLFNKSL